eukprot:350475_1
MDIQDVPAGASRGRRESKYLIKITGSHMVNKLVNRYLVFNIQVRGQDHEITRRYSDFYWLREWLINQFPGAFVPPIPPKLNMATWRNGYLVGRKKGLSHMINEMAEWTHIRKCECFEMFVSQTDSTFRTEKKKFDARNRRPTPQQLVSNMRTAFGHMFEDESDFNELDDDKWSDLTDWIGKSVEHLKSMKECVDNIVYNYEVVGGVSQKMSEDLKELIELEDGKTCIRSDPKMFVDGAQFVVPEMRVNIVQPIKSWCTWLSSRARTSPLTLRQSRTTWITSTKSSRPWNR